MLWDEIHFPFDPSLAEASDLAGRPVSRNAESGSQQQIEELYQCDSTGSIAVSISNLSAGYSRTYRLGHGRVDEKPVKPAATKRKKSGQSVTTAKS